jgi:predicted O-methyltransferase YrrM
MEDSIRRNLALSPLGDKIELVIGDAKEWLAQQEKGAGFDLVFIDADKKEYSDYLDLVLPLMRDGGWILADNTLWDGHIVEEAYDKDRQTVALRAFNDKVANDERLENVILPLRDGLTIIRVKNNVE